MNMWSPQVCSYVIVFVVWQLYVAICQQVTPGKRSALNLVDLKVFEENSTDLEIFDLESYFRASNYENIHSNVVPKFVTTIPSLRRYFRYDNEFGKLFVAERLDRETICTQSLERCYVQAELRIPSFETIKLNIEILDINDHGPEFKDTSYEKQVSESSPLGILFHLPPATDLDTGKNAELSYSLVQPPSSPFRLNVQRDPLNKIVDLRLELVSFLDRETQDSYRLAIVATDSGNPPLSGSTVINIKVLDENDNHPVFESPLYSTEIRPDDPIGLSVLTVTANDKDAGKNGRIRYFFSKKANDIYGRLFSINSETGEIKLTSKVSDQRQLTPPFNFIVQAEDYGLNQIAGSTKVEINVINTNNHAPSINIESQFKGSDSTNLIVEENNVANFVAANVIVHDADMGADGLVDCKVKETDLFDIVRIFDDVFQLIVKYPLDHETQGLHKATIECEDMGEPALTSSLEVNLIVTDIDDNAPLFSKPQYTAIIYENNLVGANIIKLEIEDLDSELIHTQTDFFIEPHFEHLFKVEQTSGTLIALVSFDREQTDRYSFHVFAKGGKLPGDNSSYRHVTKTLVNLTILDVDDEVPRFVQPWFKFEILENTPAGSIVGKVEAVDLDQPPNNVFQYSLQLSSASQSKSRFISAQIERQLQLNLQQQSSDLPFGIDSSSGTIFTKIPLDREERSHYEFMVYVTNQSATIFVDVIDVNDNTPQWSFPRPDSCQNLESLRLKGNLTFAQYLAKVAASDKDAGKNSEIVYAITSGNDLNQFSLETKSGKLSWNSYLSGLMVHNQCHARLTFRAQDLGEPALFSETACLDVVFGECLAHQERLQQTSPNLSKDAVEGSHSKSVFSEFYFIIIVVVLICCIIIAIVLTAAICITRQQTRAMKREKFRQSDLRASIPLAGQDGDAVLVLDRSPTDESSDQLTGILVSLRSAEQLGRLQLRSLAPSKDSLMSTSTSLHRGGDADSGYADVSPV